MGQLDGAGIEELTQQLCSAFTLRQLEQLVRVTMGDQLFVEYVPTQWAGQDTVFALVEELERRGTTARLLGGVLRTRPERDDLKKVIIRLCPALAAPADA